MTLLDYDTESIDQFIVDWGESITIITHSAAYDDDGVKTDTTSSTAGQLGYVRVVSREEAVSSFGKFSPGDVLVLFKSNQTLLVTGNTLVIASQNYDIIDVIRPLISIGHYEILARKSN